jgi:hypothetical protein
LRRGRGWGKRGGSFMRGREIEDEMVRGITWACYAGVVWKVWGGTWISGPCMMVKCVTRKESGVTCGGHQVMWEGVNVRDWMCMNGRGHLEKIGIFWDQVHGFNRSFLYHSVDCLWIRQKVMPFLCTSLLRLATVFHEAERLKSETMFSSPSIPDMVKDWQHWVALWGIF